MFLRHFALLGLAVACVAQSRSATNPGSDWRVTGGDAGNSRYSTLAQVNRRTVASLRVAWIYNTADRSGNSQIQATPVVVDGALYTTTQALAVVALPAH